MGIFFLLQNLPGPRVFTLDAQTLISAGFHVFNVALLAFVLSKLLYNPVREYLLKRTMRIREEMRSAEETKKQADGLLEEYAQKILEIDWERDEILNEARREAAEKSREIIAQARGEAEAMTTRALNDMEQERERMKDELRLAILDVSSALTEKFILKTVDQQASDRLFNELMAELEEAEFRRAGII